VGEKEDLVGNRIIRVEGLNEYGRSLVRLGLRAQRMETVLKMIQWGGPDGALCGLGACPACSRFPSQGHDEACFLAEALRHRDPITHAESCIRYIKGLVMEQRSTLRDFSASLDETMANLESALAHAEDVLTKL
jgi:hypothetical protein